MITSNPEFNRNIWLEVTSSRLVTMPLILSILFYLIYSIHGQELNSGAASNVVVIYAILTIFWGASMASESVLSEVRDHTWDNQRMSSMSAWTLVWGKLFGSTIYSWYGAFFCLLIYAFSVEFPLLLLIKYLVLLVACGLWAQGLAMLFSIMSFRKDAEVNKGKALGLTFIVSAPLATVLSITLKGTMVAWYGFSIPMIDFSLCSVVGFLGWTWLGNQRLIRTELQTMNGIGIWLAFVVYTMVYFSGFSSPVEIASLDRASVYMMNAFYIAVILTYLMIFSESKAPMHYVAILRSVKERRWASLQCSLSCWMGALILAGISGAVNIAILIPDAQSASALLVVAIFLFVLRDICIILYLNFSKQKKRSDITGILYLAILYIVLPAIVSLAGNGTLSAIFRPSLSGSNIVVSICAASLESVLMYWLMRKRWKENKA